MNQIRQPRLLCKVQGVELHQLGKTEINSFHWLYSQAKKEATIKIRCSFGGNLSQLSTTSQLTMAPAKQSQPPGMLLPVLCAGHATGVQLPAKKGLALETGHVVNLPKTGHGKMDLPAQVGPLRQKDRFFKYYVYIYIYILELTKVFTI